MELDKKRGIEFSLSNENPEEKFLVDMFGQITGRLKQTYNYSDEQILKLWNSENNFSVPVTIFSGKLSPSEALAKFLKEKHELGYNEISALIGRDERSIWANYRRASKKMPWHFDIKDGMAVPVSIFNCDKSILESLVSYLKDVKKLRNKKIAQMLNKNPANIWTVSSRARKKDSSKNENK